VKYWVEVMDKDTEAIEMERIAQLRQNEIDRFIESFGGERHKDSMIANEFGLSL
jgi:hypothetical protein